MPSRPAYAGRSASRRATPADALPASIAPDAPAPADAAPAPDTRPDTASGPSSLPSDPSAPSAAPSPLSVDPDALPPDPADAGPAGAADPLGTDTDAPVPSKAALDALRASIAPAPDGTAGHFLRLQSLTGDDHHFPALLEAIREYADGFEYEVSTIEPETASLMVAAAASLVTGPNGARFDSRAVAAADPVAAGIALKPFPGRAAAKQQAAEAVRAVTASPAVQREAREDARRGARHAATIAAAARNEPAPLQRLAPSEATPTDSFAIAFLGALAGRRPFTSGTLYNAADPTRSGPLSELVGLNYVGPDKIPLSLRHAPKATQIVRRLAGLGWVQPIGRGRGLVVPDADAARGGWGHCFVLTDAGAAAAAAYPVGRAVAPAIGYAEALGRVLVSARDAQGRLSEPVERWRAAGGAI